MKKNTFKIVGHRGARGLAPENTLAAIRKGLKHDVDELEVDVRVTKDGVVVVHHDISLRDGSGATYRISQHKYAELLRHKSDLPTLQQAIETIARQVPLQIEVKWGEPTAPVIAIVQTYLKKGWQASDFLIGAKKHRTLVELHRALPDIPKVVIEPFSGVRASWRARDIGTKRISMRSWWLWSGFVKAMSRNGYQLYAYTLNDPKKARRWKKSGLAGVITDYPDLFQ